MFEKQFPKANNRNPERDPTPPPALAARAMLGAARMLVALDGGDAIALRAAADRLLVDAAHVVAWINSLSERTDADPAR